MRRDRGQKPGVRRCVRRDVDACRGNKEVKSAYRPPPPAAPPPHPRKMKMLEVKNTAWLHARISGGTRGCPAAGEAERTAGELLITRAIHRLSCSVSNQGGSWGFRGIKYGLRVNRRRRGLVALTGKKVYGATRGRRRGRVRAEVRLREWLVRPYDNTPSPSNKKIYCEGVTCMRQVN